MKQNNYISYAIQFLLLAVLQIIIIKQEYVIFNGMGFCFVYIMFLLGLPLSLPRSITMTIGMISGLIIDTFYNTPGMNAAACVLIMYLRPYTYKFLNPQGGIESIFNISISSVGFRWFSIYALSLIFIHHSCLFLIHTASTSLIWTTIGKIFISTLYSYLVVLLIQYLFFASRSKR